MEETYRIPVWKRSTFDVGRPDGEIPSKAEIVIVGGGFLGLSTALAVARAGRDTVVLEAGAIGEGASGLNGGQVIPGIKHDPEWILDRYGAGPGNRMIEFVSSTADCVFDLIRSENLDVAHMRTGWIQAAHTETAVERLMERNRQWQVRAANVALLDQKDVEALTGAKGYIGGWLDRRAGTVDPLSLVTEMARIARAAGARIFENARAARVTRREGAIELVLANGRSILAGRVLVATNAYSDGLIPGLAESIVPLHSFQIATAPLPEAVLEAILPQGQAVSDSRRILVYYRKSPDGRLVLGGRGRMGIPRSAADWAHLQHALLRLYPQLTGIAIDKRWYGRVCVTPDHMPKIHEPIPGLIAVAGCQGRGVGLMTALGPRIARYFIEGEDEALPFPVTPIQPIPFHRFRKIGVAAMIGLYRALDAMEK